jgi:anti-sigma factor ChrR (cupin superfamily)
METSAEAVTIHPPARSAANVPEENARRAVDMEAIMALLAFAMPAAPPSDALWPRIEARIAGKGSGRILRRDEGWRPYTRDVEIKPLWDRNTFLLRCAPGGELAPHKHRRFEHCVIIEGDMIVGGETYRCGDYHGVPAHVAHSTITSRTGLLMLVRYQ